MAKRYQLLDAETWSMHNPRFSMPSLAERRDLNIGDYAKLMFVFADGRERMWVKVTGKYIATYPQYIGELANHPAGDGAILGDQVLFDAKNVIDILRSSS